MVREDPIESESTSDSSDSSSSRGSSDSNEKAFMPVELDAAPSRCAGLDSVGEKYPLAGQIKEEKVRNLRTAESTRSTLTEETLLPLLNYPHCRKVRIYPTKSKDRIHTPILGCTGFYSQALALGIGLPVHPFFISVLGSYGIAPGQLTPFAWCNLLGTYFLWSDLGFGEPSLDIWHYLFRIQQVNGHPLFYFFTRRHADRGPLLSNYPSSSGNWRTRFFHLDVATGGVGLLEEFAEASIIDKPNLTVHEFEQIEAAYAVEDRSWKKVIRGRIVSAMGRFRLSGNQEKVKAAARTTKEIAGSSNPKRKEIESTGHLDSMTQRKKSKTSQKELIESSKHSVPSSAIIESTGNKGKSVETVDASPPSSRPVKLDAFFEEIKKAFSRSSIRVDTGSLSIEQKSRMSFDTVIKGLYAHYEVLDEFDDLQGPLREKLLDLTRQLAETESELEVANRVLKRKDDAIAKLEKKKGDADTVIDALKADLDESEKKRVEETDELRGQIESLSEENKLLKTGEGLDFELLVELPNFAPIKECIEDCTGEELIRRINEVHPDWDLSFLSADAESPDGRGQRGDDEASPPNAIDEQAAPNSTAEGGPA